MAYLALARKYRPQRFADMIGQEHITRTLINAIKTDHVHHAYLFCGVRGLGKTTAARILAKCLVCERGPTPEPCDECEQCRAVIEGRSVDVLEIDGASNNGVEHIRALREQVHYLPHSARRKIYIIDEVHMLSGAAFNALLKTLEEPPPHVTFMFATTDPHKVLPTILSRVSRFDYRRVRASTLVPFLQNILDQEGFAVDEAGLHVIARCGEGSVRDSLTLLDKVIAFAADPKAIDEAEVLAVLGQASRFTIAGLVQAIIDRDAIEVLRRFEALGESGSDLEQLAQSILQHLRDLAVLKVTGSGNVLLDLSEDLLVQMRAQADSVDAGVVAQWFDRFSRVFEDLEATRVPKLVIEMALLDLVQSEALIPLGDLIERLDALAGGRPPPGGSGARTPVRATPPTRPSVERGGGSRAATGAAGAPAKETGSFQDRLWQMVRGGDQSGDLPRSAPATGAPSVEPAASEATGPRSFILRNEDVPREPAPDPEAGCPSSRCEPREAIAWQAIAPWDAWELFLERTRGEDSMVSSLLARVGLAELAPGAIRLAAPAGSFEQAQLRDNAELRAAIERLMAEYFGERMRLELLDASPGLPPGHPSLELVERERQRRHVEAIEADAATHPRIRSVLVKLEGRLERVEPLGAPALPPIGQRGLPV